MPTATPPARLPSRTSQVRTQPEGGRRELGWALAAAVMLWLSFPPAGAWALAWIAPFGWLRLIRQPDWQSRHPYRMLYAVGWFHWMLMIQWVRLPHWSAYFGWCVLAAYLGVYIPLFVGITRILVHRWQWSSVLAAPIVWTALELIRSRLFTGFALLLLGHSQLPMLPIVQISDIFGAFGVSFCVMLVAAALERLVPQPGQRRVVWPVVPALVCTAASLIYGMAQMRLVDAAESDGRTLRAALIQGAFDTQFDGDPERPRQAFFDYARLSREAAAEYSDLDVMIWPESMFTETAGMITYQEPLQTIDGWEQSLDQLRQWLDRYEAAVLARFAWMAQQVNTPLLVGIAWDHYVEGQARRYNAAVLADSQGQILDRYDKMHPVMFGEYVPFAKWFPWLYRLTPMPDGLTPGTQPKSFQVGEVRVAPTICFENTVPHLMRRQIRELNRRGESPDVLVTITNDGWFWGSSLLDIHLACGQFRAIEFRRPLLIAANTGFSAWVDATGRLRARGPRRAPGTLLAEVHVGSVASRYLAAGDWFAGLCLLISGVAVVDHGRARWLRLRRASWVASPCSRNLAR